MPVTWTSALNFALPAGCVLDAARNNVTTLNITSATVASTARPGFTGVIHYVCTIPIATHVNALNQVVTDDFTWVAGTGAKGARRQGCKGRGAAQAGAARARGLLPVARPHAGPRPTRAQLLPLCPGCNATASRNLTVAFEPAVDAVVAQAPQQTCAASPELPVTYKVRARRGPRPRPGGAGQVLQQARAAAGTWAAAHAVCAPKLAVA